MREAETREEMESKKVRERQSVKERGRETATETKKQGRSERVGALREYPWPTVGCESPLFRVVTQAHTLI